MLILVLSIKIGIYHRLKNHPVSKGIHGKAGDAIERLRGRAWALAG
jgi:hypothetical protein